MQRRGLVFLLISGCLLVVRLQSDGLIRVFHPIKQKMIWSKAQSYCRDKYTDLATIQNRDQNHQAHQVALTGDPFWIGLFNQSWRWSGENRVFRTRNTFVNWNGSHNRWCATLSQDRTWGTMDCGEQNSLLCYSAEHQKHFLVKPKMRWGQAKRYCRTNYTNLSSIKSNEENINVSRLLEEGGEDKAWIGLHRHFWTWSDGSSAAFRRFAEQQSHYKKKDCVMMDSNKWHSEDCSEKLSFICYKDQKHTALKMVKVRLRVGSADLSDPELQDAILRQLQQKLEEAGVTQEVKLSWRRSSDGNIFTREEEEEL